tara:strand:+ start:7774 stop:8088 length:315 start_codon:yes stop_codon:yes gene_type:complete
VVVDKIYEQLRDIDNRLSKSKFSREYLGKDRNYWFVCRYNNTDISNNALLSLYGNLRRYSSIWLEMSEDVSTRNAAHYKERFRFMNGLADLVLTEIERRARDVI